MFRCCQNWLKDRCIINLAVSQNLMPTFQVLCAITSYKFCWVRAKISVVPIPLLFRYRLYRKYILWIRRYIKAFYSSVLALLPSQVFKVIFTVPFFRATLFALVRSAVIIMVTGAHRLRGSGSTVVTMTSKVNGTMEISTPCRSETPENIETKIGHNDYVMGPFHPANFRRSRSNGVRSPYS